MLVINFNRKLKIFTDFTDQVEALDISHENGYFTIVLLNGKHVVYACGQHIKSIEIIPVRIDLGNVVILKSDQGSNVPFDLVGNRFLISAIDGDNLKVKLSKTAVKEFTAPIMNFVDNRYICIKNYK